MKLQKLFAKKSMPASLRLKVYDSIHNLPQWNWNKVHETANLGYLERLDNYKDVKHLVTKKLSELWEEINDELFTTFGASEENEQILRLQRNQAILRCELLITDDRTNVTLIKIKDQEIDALKQTDEPAPYHDSITAMEKYMNYKIEPKGITVYNYQRIIADIKKQSEHGQANKA